MNIVVTGGAGYIGAELVKSLLTQPGVDKVTVYDNLARKNYNFFSAYQLDSARVQLVEGDLLDSRKLRGTLKNADVVYHLAALTDKNPSLDSHLFEQVNHWGTAELINAVEESKVERVVYLSSTAVYGGGAEVFTESVEANPQTFYATSKWRGEAQVQRLSESKKTFIVRVGNVYGFGPCLRLDGVINKFMFDANFKGRIQIIGNGRQLRSYIHVDKVVGALVQMLKADAPSDVYNLTDKNMQVLDIVEVLQDIYPKLEFIFINQHLKIEDLQVEAKGKISNIVQLPATHLKDELLAFKKQFSF